MCTSLSERTGARAPVLAILCFLIAGCLGDDGTTAPDPPAADLVERCGYPVGPAGVDAFVFVSPTCAIAEPDGSAERPFATLLEALTALPKNAAILAEAGTYEGSLRLTESVSIMGSFDADGAPQLLITPSGKGPTVSVEGGRAALSALTVKGGTGAGIRVRGAELALDGVVVSDVSATDGQEDGHGVDAEGGRVEIRNSTVRACAGVGVRLTETIGIILNNLVADNGLGGVRIERPTEPMEVRQNLVMGNGRVGVAMVEARGIILNNFVSDTAPVGESTVADGVHITGKGADVRVEDNKVKDNGRGGIFGTGEVIGIILNNLVSGNGRVGIWLQSGAGTAADIRVENNRVSNNAMVGIGLTSEARGIILNNLVSGTSTGTPADGEVEMGDGIGLFAGAFGEVRANDVRDNARAGIIADQPHADTVIAENTTEGNAFEVVIQGLEDYAMATSAPPEGPESTPGDGSGGSSNEPDSDVPAARSDLGLAVNAGDLGSL